MLLIVQLNVAYCAIECCLLNLKTPENTAFAIAENKYKTSIKQDIKQANKQGKLKLKFLTLIS